MLTMEMKQIKAGSVQLAYAEQNPSKKHTLFFINSNSSSKLWRHQFSSSLFESYRLIAVELPGHGASEKSSDPAFDFSVKGSAFLLSTAVKLLAGNNPYTLIGFSYDTNLVAEMLGFDLNPTGIVLISSSITGKNFELDKIVRHGVSNIYLQEQNSFAETEAFYNEHLVNSTEDDKEIYINDFMEVQPLFRTTVLQCVLQGNYSDEIELLQTVSVPLLLIWGASDSLLNKDYLNNAPFKLWNGQSYTLNQCGHFVITDQPHLLNQLIVTYIQEVTTK